MAPTVVVAPLPLPPQFGQVKRIRTVMQLEERWASKKDIWPAYADPTRLVDVIKTIPALLDELVSKCFSLSAVNASRRWKEEEIACLKVGGYTKAVPFRAERRREMLLCLIRTVAAGAAFGAWMEGRGGCFVRVAAAGGGRQVEGGREAASPAAHTEGEIDGPRSYFDLQNDTSEEFSYPVV